MTHTVFIDLDSHVATASATGTAAPDVPFKHLTKQTLAFAFHSGGTVSAVTGWTTGRVVIKATPTSSVLLLDTALVETGSTTSTRYSAEWAAVDCDSAALRTLIGASVEPLDVYAEIQWTADSGTHSVSFPIELVPTFNLPEDDPPDPTSDASWTWLKARLAAGDDISFSDNDTTKVRTIAVASGIDAAKIADGSVSDAEFQYLNGVTSALQTQLNNKQPLDTELTAFAALANASGVLTNNGSGTLSYTGTSQGGNGAGDSLKLATYSSVGQLSAVNLRTIDGNLILLNTTSGFSHNIVGSTLTNSRTHTLADVDGTFITTGNLSSITSVGTIASGTWQGAAVGVAYGGTGATTAAAARVALLPSLTGNAGKVLAVNGGATDVEWITGGSGGGLTIGTSTITSGTSGRVLYNNGGVVGELTTTGSGSVVLATSPSFGGNVDVVDGSNYFRSTWSGFFGYDNALGVKFQMIGADPFVSGGAAMRFGALGSIVWQSTNRVDAGTADLFIWRRASGALFQRNSTNAQWFGVSNTYTSATSYEAGVFDWQTTSNTLRIGSDVGSGGGTARDVQHIRGGVVKLTLGANTTDHAQPVKAAVYTVATLPAAGTAGAYSIAAVSDADSPSVGATVTGGGSTKALVCSDGTNWKVIAVL